MIEFFKCIQEFLHPHYIGVHRLCIRDFKCVVRQTGKYFSISHRIIATMITVYLLYSGLSGDMMINGYFDNEYLWLV
jgi:hypothetical protein